MHMMKFKIFGISTFLLFAGNFLVFAGEKTEKNAIEQQQTKRITGTVTDKNGEPLIGATVNVTGTTNGVSTDTDGKFSLNVGTNATLQVNYIGYISLKITVGNQTNIPIILEEDTQQLKEIVVVAFGTAKKEAFTGSAGIVGAENIQLSQQSNVIQSLAGRVAGVQLSNESGQFGSSPSILVRGYGSISSGNEPLYVVDGMPFDGDLNNLNPADIESLTILKDAASNALYGARGANGVIMITTKKAKRGEAKITFDTRIGVNTVALKNYNYIKDPALYYETYYKSVYNQFMTTDGYDAVRAHREANDMVSGKTNDNYFVYTVPNGQDFIINGKVNPEATLGRKVNFEGQDYWLQPEDWLKEGTKQGLRQEYNLSVSGSEGKLSYLSSLGYLKNEGITTGSEMERINVRLKSDYQAKEWLRTGMNLSYTHSDYNKVSEGTIGSTGSVWSMATGIGPVYPVYIRDGNKNIMRDSYGEIMYDFGDVAGLGRPAFTGSNPLFTNKYNKNQTGMNAFTGSGFFDINFLENLKLTVNGGVNTDQSRYTYVSDPYAELYSTTQNGGYVYKSNSQRFSYNIQQILNYNETFGQNNLNIMLGHEYYNNIYNFLSGSKTKMFSSDNLELDGAISDSGAARSYSGEYNNEGYFTRVQYDYAGKYFLSGSFRRDASSRFLPENRWGNFWSAGGAWLINKENWFDVSSVDMLKLKASIGSQGNDNIGDYLFSDQYNIENNSGEISLVLKQKGNKNITWETNTNINGGFEVDLFNKRLNASVDLFYRKTTDMLFEFFVAPSNGYTSYFDNIGDMRNKGIELELRGDILRTKDLVWSANFNITHVSNKILSLPEERKTLTVESYDGYTLKENRFAHPSEYFIGEGIPLYTFYARKYAGVNEEGLSTWYKDIIDENGKVTGQETTTALAQGTQYLCGSALPKAYGGFGTTVNYKGFDLTMNFNYQLGGLVYDYEYGSAMSSPSGKFGGNIHKDLLNAWTPENSNSNIPRLNGKDPNQGAVSNTPSDRYLTSARFLNFQNLNLGYTLPSKLTNQWKISHCRIYLSAENIWYKSARQGLDPRYSFSGTTNGQTYSPIRTISGGLSMQF
ncbi:SusC/RagA family TonB-linked outer membrane protein [Bacteroidia bacterium]|nr:SusC/RagA family TonB-linked outer membrane protein [Bacteroidia bacterium]